MQTLRIYFISVVVGIFSFSCATLGPRDQASNLERLRVELDHTLSNPDFANANWGVAIQSLQTGEYIYLHNENKGFIPASNLKLFTTATALVKLTPEYRFVTNLYRKGDIVQGTLQGDLIIQGAGDPSITARYHNGNPLAVFQSWLDSLKALGVQKIAGNIVGDDNYFADEMLGKGWAWDDLPDWYAAQISALSFNDNCVDIIFSPGKAVGDTVTYRLEPDTKYVHLWNYVTTAKAGQEQEITYWRRCGTNEVVIRGALPINENEKRDWFSVENPTLFTVYVFQEFLQKNGIQVQGCAVDIDDLQGYWYQPSAEQRVATYQSPPLAKLVETINKVSQNLYAELLLRTLGKEFKGVGDAAHGVGVIKEFLAGIGINSQKINIVDGSGLSRLNLVTPLQVITLLRYMRGNAYYYDSLPVAGRDGTLQLRMLGTAAEANVRAKTGSFEGVRALSGYVSSKDGEEFVFSMIVNNYTTPASMATNLQDWVCERLANFRRGF